MGPLLLEAIAWPHATFQCRVTLGPAVQADSSAPPFLPHMSPAKPSQVVADEETPLLHDDSALRKPTPLPKTQLFLLLLVRLAEPITSHSISPYISEVGSH